MLTYIDQAEGQYIPYEDVSHAHPALHSPKSSSYPAHPARLAYLSAGIVIVIVAGIAVPGIFS